MKLGTKLIFLALLTYSLPSFANCYYEGKYYPIGTQIGGVVCTPNGWK